MLLNYAIVFVSDMKRSVAFYRHVLGLPLKFETPGWTEFATEGATLALHKSERPGPQDDPQAVPAGRCRPGLSVANLDEFHRRMVEQKGPLHPGAKGRVRRSDRAVRRSDGLEISVSEQK